MRKTKRAIRKIQALGDIWLSSLLRVEDAPEAHEQLTKRFGTPDTVYRRGDRIPYRQNENYSFSLWCIEDSFKFESNIEKHLDWVNRLIEGHERFLRKLAAQGTPAVFHVAIHTGSFAMTHWDIDPADFVLLHRAKVGLEICIYAR